MRISAHPDHPFRTKPITPFGRRRSPVSVIPINCFGRCRSPVSADVDQAIRLMAITR
jgi:hypothetical protein